MVILKLNASDWSKIARHINTLEFRYKYVRDNMAARKDGWSTIEIFSVGAITATEEDIKHVRDLFIQSMITIIRHFKDGTVVTPEYLESCLDIKVNPRKGDYRAVDGYFFIIKARAKGAKYGVC